MLKCSALEIDTRGKKMKAIRFMAGGSFGGATENAMRASSTGGSMMERDFIIGPLGLNTMAFLRMEKSLAWGLDIILIVVYTLASGLKGRIMERGPFIGNQLFFFSILLYFIIYCFLIK